MIALPAQAAAWLLPVVVAAPLLGLVGLTHRQVRGRIHWLVPVLALPGLMAGLALPDGAGVTLPWLLTGMTLTLDAAGRVFLLLAAFLWLTAGAFAAAYLAGDPRRHRFYGFYLAAMAGNLGLTVAGDPTAFLAFFALMGLSAYGLIAHGGTPVARRAANVYIAATITAEMLLFAGLVSTAPGGLAGWSGVIVVALGIKAALLPVHVWLPLAYSAAPAPAAAVLAGSVTQAALLGWLRFLPLGQAALPGWGELLLSLGLAGAFGGVAAGLLQREPGAVLAYSSISQIGWMTTAVGAGLVAPAAWPVLLPVVLGSVAHHGLAKAALFLGTGVAAGGARSPAHRGVIVAGLLLPSLSLAGLVLTSGSAVKWGLKKAITAIPQLSGLPWETLLSAGAAATALLMARFVYLAWPASRRPDAPIPRGPEAWWGLVVAASLTLPWGWHTLRAWHGAALHHWPAYVGPVAGAALIAALVAAITWRRRLAIPVVLPAGDLYVLLERAYAKGRRALTGHDRHWQRLWVPGNRLWATITAYGWRPWTSRLTASDQWTWRTSGVAFLLILLGTVAALLIGA